MLVVQKQCRDVEALPPTLTLPPCGGGNKGGRREPQTHYQRTPPRRPPMTDARAQFTFFWHGPFSQWHGCTFRVDGVAYNCAEQYMMAQKAVLFGDEEAWGK